MLKIIFIILISLGILYIYLYQKELTVATAVEGVLISNGGEPMVGTKIVRTWYWSWTNTQGQDEVVTDIHGTFSFPAITSKSVSAQIAPHEPNIDITLTAHAEDRAIEIFAMSKNNYHQTGVLDNEWQYRPLNLLCGIDALPGTPNQMAYSGKCIFNDTTTAGGE